MLSSLQSQLAALKNPAGTAVASNRKHDNAVGRGVKFSVQTGKQSQGGDSHRFQVSLIYNSTAEAADVPLSTLKAQYESALVQLDSDELMTAAARLEEASSPSMSRTGVVAILSILAAFLLERPKSEADAIIQCLEYLLRAYQLHTLYPMDLLWTVLAASDYPKLQHRVLELIDWAEHQSYLWLRPYVAVATTTGGFPPRKIIAQYVMKETPILRTMCTWSTTRIGNRSPKFLSFTAAVLLQGLKQIHEDQSDQVEAILRILLPAIAPTSSAQNHQNMLTNESDDDEVDLPRWQLVLASAVAEAVPLSQALIDFLCTRILTSNNYLLHSLGCVVSILLARQTPTQITNEQLQYMLEIPDKDKGEVLVLGSTQLSQPIFSALSRIDDLASHLGDLNMVIAPLVVSLILHCERDLSISFVERNRRIVDLLRLEAKLLPTFLSTRKFHPDTEKVIRKEFHMPLDKRTEKTEAMAYHASIEWLLAQSPPAWAAMLLRMSSPLEVTAREKSLIARSTVNTAALPREGIQALAFCGSEAWPVLVGQCSRPMLRAVAKESLLYNCRCGGSVDVWIVENAQHIVETKSVTSNPRLLCACIETIASAFMATEPQIGVPTKQVLYQTVSDFMLSRNAQMPRQSEAFFTVLSQTLILLRKTLTNDEVVDSIAQLSGCSAALREKVVAPLIRSTDVKCSASQESVPADLLILECAVRSPVNSDWLVSLLQVFSCDACLVPVLALIKTGNESTRMTIVKLLSGSLEESQSSRISKDVKDLCKQIASQETSAKMGGPSFLLSLLSKSKTLKPLTALWVDNALGLLDDKKRSQWISTSAAAAPIADVVEALEEGIFPLLQRWESMGKPLLHQLDAIPVTIQLFIFRMMKGITARKPHIVASTGPSGTGGRSRSYSIGSEDILLLKPYPDTMIIALKEALNSSDASVAARMVDVVFNSQTWRERVFQTMPIDQKGHIVETFASYLCEKNSELSAQDAFYKLPLSADEVIVLFIKMAGQIGPLSLLVEYIGENSHVIASSKNTCVKVVSHLFDAIEDPRWRESLVLPAMITALKKLFAHISEFNHRVDFGKNALDEWTTCLISMFVETTDVQAKLRPGILSLLLQMCPLSPTQLVDPIIQCVLLCVDDSSDVLISRIISMVVPVYLKHVSLAKQPTIHLYASILGRLKQGEHDRAVIGAVCRSLLDIPSTNKTSELVTFLLTIIGKGVYESADNVGTCTDIFYSNVQSSKKLMVLHEFLEHIHSLLTLDKSAAFIYSSERTDDQKRDLDARCRFLTAIASNGAITSKECLPRVKNQGPATLSFALAIMRLINEALLDHDVQILLKDSKHSPTVMQIWNILLSLEFNAQRNFTGEETVERYEQNAMLSTLNEVRVSIQNVLPPQDFVTSVGSIISSSPEAAIQSLAFQIFADRAIDVNERYPEQISSFLGILPATIRSLQQMTEKEHSKDGSVVIQAAFVVVEQIARSCGPSLSHLRCDKKTTEDTRGSFKKALECCTNLVQNQTDNVELTCSGALCAASLIRVLLADSLPFLAALLTALVTKLTGEEYAEKEFTTALFQVSLLRPIVSIVESMPMFISSSLPMILKVICSTRIAETKEVSVVESMKRLESTLVDGVEPRLLINAITTFLKDDLELGNHAKVALLGMLENSTTKANSSCIATHQPLLLSAICDALEDTVTRTVGENILCTMILKMNESQLKSVYRHLRDWLHKDPSAAKEIAFWSVSCRLAKQLRSIFLPCFTFVFPDLLATLSNVAKAKEEPPSKKRRKTKDSSGATTSSSSSHEVLSAALSALEQVLRADSHQGGEWLRDDGNSKERFESILEIMDGLMLHVPNVVGLAPCVTALALAGGDDVFWKPLNHSVLRVCQVEGSSVDNTNCRVRLGLECLLELMKALGEEYMTLLPEILPVLAELLEDADEDIIALARQVVVYAETLTGEDLEEKLR